MNEAVRFLTALAQALSTMTLYAEGHPARERVIDGVHEALLRLLEREPDPIFTFLEDSVLLGREPIRELRRWDWTARLASAGVQRLECEAGIGRDDLEVFLEEILDRLAGTPVQSVTARQTRPTRIRYGTVGVHQTEAPPAQPEAKTDLLRLSAEASAVQWIHRELSAGSELHLQEAEAVVRSLSLAMHSDRQLIMPLVALRTFDEYTTTHALNVSVLSMALAEFMNLGAREIRVFGVAGLLHDIGKITIPDEVLNKPGKLSPEEWQLMSRHPVAGAQILLDDPHDLDLAAIVAYEHHVMVDGGGYPSLRDRRPCHHASLMVHVCDVYDALRTNRPYRGAWPAAKVLNYIRERAGSEFDEDVARGFCEMMERWEPRVATIDEAVPAG